MEQHADGETSVQETTELETDDQETNTTDLPVEVTACPNCGHHHSGPYCNRCGQRQFGRLTLRRLMTYFIRRVLDLEKGVWPTLKMLTVDPGDLVRRYLKGQRRKFINPVSYFIVTTGLDAVITSVVQFLNSEEQYTIPYGPRRGEAVSSINELPDAQQAGVEAHNFAMDLLVNYPALSRLVVAVLAAGGLRVFFSKERLNWAEALATTCILYGHLILIKATFYTPLSTALIRSGLEGSIPWLISALTVLGTGWLAWAGYRALGHTWKGATYLSISAIGAYLITVILVSVSIGFYISTQAGNPRLASIIPWFL